MVTQLQELNEKLEKARAAYYAGNPIMSDAEYDALEQELAGLAKKTGELPSVLTTVGTDAPGRIKHDVPMRSIQNYYSVDEVIAWYGSLEPGEFATCASKWDGVSCSLTYEGGKLVKAVTRGDGEAGESILAQVEIMASIPKTIPIEYKIEIRVELVMRQSVLNALNVEIIRAGGKPYASTRNLVAGTIKLKDLSEVAKRQIEPRPWEVICETLDREDPETVLAADSAAARLRELVEFGFPEPDDELAVNGVALRQNLEKAIEGLKNGDQEIGRDGIVIKVNSVRRRKELGFGSKFANFQICFKPQNSQAETVLKDVIWQVGRQGRLTPVGVVEPVILAGATIERVTLNNYSWIQEMGLKIGSRVMLMRSGDVIPKVVEVLDGD